MAASQKVSCSSCLPLPLLTESEDEHEFVLENDDSIDVHTRLSTEEPEHTYAVLEQTQTQVILPTGLEESEQHDIMILEPTSPLVSDKHSSRDVGLELQIYDKVSLVRVPSQGETAEGVEYDQLLRPRKQSLPADLGDLPTISQYSVLNTSAHPKQRKKTPVYSVPDAKKKKDIERRKRATEKQK